MIRSLVVVPGRTPHWVADHARHLGQRLTENGRVLVVFTHSSHARNLLPGQPGAGSVLGHSVSGYPIWTGRLRAALGVRRAGSVTIIVLWNEANHALALWSAIVARLRGERLVIDIPEVTAPRERATQRIVRSLLRRLATNVVRGEVAPPEPGRTRVVVALCGADHVFAQLMVNTFDGMSNAAADRWRFLVHVENGSTHVSSEGRRRQGKITVLDAAPTTEMLRSADVVIADFGGAFEDEAHHAVLSGGAGIVVGQPVAGRIAHCHDGVWFAQRDPASILVAVETSSGDQADRPGSVLEMRELANEVVGIVERGPTRQVAA